MPKLVKDETIVEDSWTLVDADADYPADAISAGDQLILPLALWQPQREVLLGKANVSVWLGSKQAPALLFGNALDDDSESVEFDINQLPLIAIDFPVFSDGRGYSYARQLRERYAFKGELRAIGDVLRDQMYFYKRCGFNSFAVRSDRDAEVAVAGLRDFSLSYQAARDEATAVIKSRHA
ncbi:MAG: DUF934 domain-containing protein [Gammaproteobacteria bacterium]|nr:DUF934 domain-containing protein [Gammaproteobacteria bacterium]NND38154.1 DUF934 domain-containing protein [Pseudomonadales bacterium]MBT8150038.1 DUF934 domain-containing protein [Gammaproteobacteria bacterium]NNL10199.1 DUF934 domain-containing protein [Pseudomonadales bacterium]NNM10542.1 DUF934 domain-containing protein [Pseudomonadales bacterium]